MNNLKISWFFEIAKEAKMAIDKDGNYSECYTMISFTLGKDITEEKARSRASVEDLVKFVSETLNITESMLKIISEEEYIKQTEGSGEIVSYTRDPGNMRKAKYFDDFVANCEHFNGETDVNNGYGCNHPNQEETEDGQGKCYCFSCPLGYSADEESLSQDDIEWEGGKPEPDSMEEDSYIILNNDEKTGEAMSKWIEIKNNYFDADGRVVSIDAWKTTDDNESGEAIARINVDTKEVTYEDDDARTDSRAQEIINETLSNIESGNYQ